MVLLYCSIKLKTGCGWPLASISPFIFTEVEFMLNIFYPTLSDSIQYILYRFVPTLHWSYRMFTLSEVFKYKTPCLLWLHCSIRWKYSRCFVHNFANIPKFTPTYLVSLETLGSRSSLGLNNVWLTNQQCNTVYYITDNNRHNFKIYNICEEDYIANFILYLVCY